MVREVFEMCMTKIAATKRMPKSAVVAYWRQRFSVVLQKYTAACVRERVRWFENRRHWVMRVVVSIIVCSRLNLQGELVL